MPYAIPPAGNAGIPPWVEHLETLLVAQVVPLETPAAGEDPPPPGLEPPDPRANPEERLLAVERLREAASLLARRRRRRAARGRRGRRRRG